MVCQSFRMLKGSEVTEEELNLARILGWCIEWVSQVILLKGQGRLCQILPTSVHVPKAMYFDE